MSTNKSTASARVTPPAEKLRPDGDDGTGLVSAFIGFTIFLVLLLFAAQVLVRLYATSALTATAFDAAREVASTPGDPVSAVPAAEAAARHRLGRFGAAHTVFTWLEADDQQVVLRVDAAAPGLMPVPGESRQIERTVTVRRERFR